MISLERKQKIDRKFFGNPAYQHDYFFNPLRMTKDGVRVLDMGCGFGQHLRFFSPESLGVTFVDDEAMRYVAEAYSLQMRKFNLDDEWPSDLGQFDVIFSSDSIIHCVSPYKLLLEMRKVLKDDGKVLLMIPQSSPFFDTDDSDLHLYTFNRRTMINSFERAGFEVEKTYGYVRRLPSWLNTLLNPLTKHWGTNLWIVARKKPGFAIAKNTYRPGWVRKDIWLP